MYMNVELLKGALQETVSIGGIALQKKELGLLNLPTGRIMVGCPAYAEDDDKVLSVSVEPGNYPVSFVGKDEVALVVLRFSNALPVHWEMAVGEGETLPVFTSDSYDADFEASYVGYYTDGGSMAFMDESFAVLRDDEAISAHMLDVNDALIHLHDHGNVMVSFDVDPMCSYPSYFGFDDSGKPCVLVADLLRMV